MKIRRRKKDFQNGLWGSAKRKKRRKKNKWERKRKGKARK